MGGGGVGREKTGPFIAKYLDSPADLAVFGCCNKAFVWPRPIRCDGAHFARNAEISFTDQVSIVTFIHLHQDRVSN
jgi:hypothetical protein